eukprot:PhF_6_TR22385/c0_g1_i3/m.31758
MSVIKAYFSTHLKLGDIPSTPTSKTSSPRGGVGQQQPPKPSRTLLPSLNTQDFTNSQSEISLTDDDGIISTPTPTKRGGGVSNNSTNNNKAFSDKLKMAVVTSRKHEDRKDPTPRTPSPAPSTPKQKKKLNIGNVLTQVTTDSHTLMPSLDTYSTGNTISCM